MGDAGIISGPDNLRIRITDTQKKLGELFVHLGTVEAGTARVGQPALATVDHERRGTSARIIPSRICCTRLCAGIGTHVTQKGSLNAPDRLRFDISQPRPITAEELAAVEREVNARIRENSEVTTRLMTPDEAVKLGAMALFGEKYGDEVRVVSMGGGMARNPPVPSSSAAARMWRAPAISACSASSPRALSRPAFAVSRPWPVGRRRREESEPPAGRSCRRDARPLPPELPGRITRFRTTRSGWSARWPSCRRSS